MSKKQTKFVLLMDYAGGTLIKIKLTKEELEESKKCSERWLHKNISEEEYDSLYDEGRGVSYWTSWLD